MSDPRTPHVGATVHYVSYSTPGGEYASMCRAAIVAEVGQWITMVSTPGESRVEGEPWKYPTRVVEQWWYPGALALAVINPAGVFFNGAAAVACKHADFDDHRPGTWHWPEHE